jgi:pyruvate dehydrogenase E1 component
MIALVGDAEMDEGNIFEALLEGWKHGLRNTWWVVDYNRQSLDAVVREGLWEKFESMFRNFGWDVVIVKYGRLMQRRVRRARRRGAAALDRRLPEPDVCGAVLPGRRGVPQASARRDRRPGRGDAIDRAAQRRRIAGLMSNLGGHDMASMIEAFEASITTGRSASSPTPSRASACRSQGHKDNHAGLMTVTADGEMARAPEHPPGHEWEKFEGLSQEPAIAGGVSRQAPFNREGRRA